METHTLVSQMAEMKCVMSSKWSKSQSGCRKDAVARLRLVGTSLALPVCERHLQQYKEKAYQDKESSIVEEKL